MLEQQSHYQLLPQQMLQQQRPSYYTDYQSQYRYEHPYTSQNQYTMGNNTNQGQKDIEMLLASIPNDVPQILLKKKKRRNSGVIEIMSDDEMDEDREDTLDNGYVEGLKCHLMDHQIKGVSWMIDRENNQSSNGGILADVNFVPFFYLFKYTKL